MAALSLDARRVSQGRLDLAPWVTPGKKRKRCGWVVEWIKSLLNDFGRSNRHVHRRELLVSIAPLRLTSFEERSVLIH